MDIPITANFISHIECGQGHITNVWSLDSRGIFGVLTQEADLKVDVHPEVKDKIVWSLDSRGIFSVRSLWGKMLASNGPYFPVNDIWKSRTPTKACFLAWAASKGKVPTEVFLKRRNFNLASRCAMCLGEEELIDHLFVHCHLVASLWSLALSLMGLSWVQPSSVKEVMFAWRRRLEKCWIQGIWKLVPLTIWWCT